MFFHRLENRELSGHSHLPDDVSALLSAYRSATPDFEANPQFTPGIWAKIETRRRESWWFGRIARGFVTVSGAFCLLLSVAMWMPRTPAAGTYLSTYVDVLANDTGSDDAVEIDVVHLISQ